MVVPLTIAYVSALEAGGVSIGISYEEIAVSGFTSSADPGDGYIWLGWLLVGCSSLLAGRWQMACVGCPACVAFCSV